MSDRRAFSVADVFELKTPGSPAVSVDGSVTAFTISETLIEENKGSSAVYVVGNEGANNEPQLLVEAPASDPKFSPDGHRLSFIRGGQVWAVGLAARLGRCGTDSWRATVLHRAGTDWAAAAATGLDCTARYCTSPRRH